MAASRETFFEPFGADARKALKRGGGHLPFVMSRPLDNPGPDELAEFKAVALASPARNAAPEPWQIDGVLYRSPQGPPIAGDVIVRHFPLGKRTPRVEVTGYALRGLPLAKIRNKALAGLKGNWQARDAWRWVVGRGVTLQDVEHARRAAQEAKKPRPGRPGHPDEHYVRIAQRYLELVRAGRRDVLVALEREESERAGRAIPRETVRDWVRKATERGYLAPGKPGRAEARPGPKLQRKEKDG